MTDRWLAELTIHHRNNILYRPIYRNLTSSILNRASTHKPRHGSNFSLFDIRHSRHLSYPTTTPPYHFSGDTLLLRPFCHTPAVFVRLAAGTSDSRTLSVAFRIAILL